MGGFLITGGTGFIGSYIAKALIEEGEQAVLYDALINERSLEVAFGKENRDKLVIVKGDVLDFAHLAGVIRDYKPKFIIHMAYMLAQASNVNPSFGIKVNCEGTNNLFEAVRLLNIKAKIVWASSCTVFGSPESHKEEYLSNDAPHYPKDIYGASKSFLERMAKFYFQEYGVNSVAMRFSPVYGAGMQGGITANLIKELIENPVLGIDGNVPFGDDVVNWLYVEDAARLLLAAAKATKIKTKAFNVSGDLRSVKDAADYVRTIIPNANLSLQPGYWGLCFKYDTSALEKEVGFKPKFTMENGIDKIVNIIRSQTKNTAS